MKKTDSSMGARRGDVLQIRGAREHNLSIDEIVLPKNKLVVFTGVSGSGKSSLAFDTIYAEGQRRYVESLSTYARQFLGQLEKPKYEQIRGLCPTIAIEQKTAASNPRSTVGTVTEIYDYLRVLFARIGDQRCPKCGSTIAGRSAADIVEDLLASAKSSQATLLAPQVEQRKGEFKDLFEDLRQRGFSRVRVDGEVRKLEDMTILDKKRKHTIEVVIDRLSLQEDARARLTDSVELTLRTGKGAMSVEIGGKLRNYSETRSCPKCKTTVAELSPQVLSYNSPLGMCPDCSGLGTRLEVDATLIVTNPDLSIDEGAIDPWRNVSASEGWTGRIVNALCAHLKVPRNKPWKNLTQKQRDAILYGVEGSRIDVAWTGKHSKGSWAMKWEGLAKQLVRRFEQTSSEGMRDKYRKYLRVAACSACSGSRLRPEARSVFIGGKSISETMMMTIAQASEFFGKLSLQGAKAIIAEEVLKEVKHRLGFLLDVGLEYLTLHRATASLSGGEAQRIRLAAQLGSELSGVMYVLDEPSIGLHQRDNVRLIATLDRLRDLGNTVIVVEHDEETIFAADHVVDFGPGAGRLGGKVVAQGTPEELMRNRDSVTARYLLREVSVADPHETRQAKGHISVVGARENNLKNLDVDIPLGVFACISGVSGAGKSSLVGQILVPALQNHFFDTQHQVGAHKKLTGLDQIDKAIVIDQDPIGRTPRSNPATYVKVFDLIREVFSQTKEARAYGYSAGRFSFNVKGGRCETCEGAGVREIEMHFLPAVFVTCETCKGKRYNEATLRVTFKGHNIAEVLAMSVSAALPVFENVPHIARVLTTLEEVGLGYVSLGQPATTLSGGEAQRVKLAKELARRDTGRTLYILDEPTTGLHFDDVKKLLRVLHRLVDAGNSVLVVEHNLDVIHSSDWIIDLGPEGGDRGGQVIAKGTVRDLIADKRSYTGQFLAVHHAKQAKPATKLGGKSTKRVAKLDVKPQNGRTNGVRAKASPSSSRRQVASNA